MRVLLDSNAYSLLMRGNDRVADLVRGAEEVLLSAIVVGELMYGFRRGTRFSRNAASLALFLENPYVSLAPVGLETARHYSMVAADLRAKGRPIPANDAWIAAQVMETRTALISADRHFEEVEGLSWVRITTDGA